MLKSKIILFVFGVITSTSIQGQVSNSVIDSLEDKQRKNEVGLNVAPAMVILMGATSIYQKFSLNYKRLNEKGAAYRSSISYIFMPLLSYNNNLRKVQINNLKLTSSKLISQTDSTETRLEELSRNDIYQINIGHEWRKQKRVVERFFGADLFLGIQRTKAINYINKYEKDSTFCTDGECFDDILSQQTANIYWIGVSPFYGWKMPLSKRLLLSVQLGYDFGFAFGKSIVNDSNNKLIKERWPISLYLLSSDMIINDISIFFSF